MAFIEAAQPQNALLALSITQGASKGVKGISGISNQTLVVQNVGDLSYPTRLRVFWVEIKEPCHNLTLHSPRRKHHPNLRARRRAASSSIEVISAPSCSI